MSGPSSVQGPPVVDKRQLVEFHEAGNKPPAAWRVGTEHEKFVSRRADLRRVPYDGPDGIGALLQGMTRFAGAGAGERPHHRAVERRPMFDHIGDAGRTVRAERRAARNRASSASWRRCWPNNKTREEGMTSRVTGCALALLTGAALLASSPNAGAGAGAFRQADPHAGRPVGGRRGPTSWRG